MTQPRGPQEGSLLSTRAAALLAATGLFFIGIMLGAVSHTSDVTVDSVASPNETRNANQDNPDVSNPVDPPTDVTTSVAGCVILDNIVIEQIEGSARTGGSVHTLGDPVGSVPVVVELLAEPSTVHTATVEGSPWVGGTLLLIRPEGVRNEVWEWEPDPGAIGANLEPVAHSEFITALVDTYATQSNCAGANYVAIDGDRTGADLALRHVCDQATSTGLVILRNPTVGLDTDVACAEAVDVVVITNSPPDEAVTATLSSIAQGLARCPKLLAGTSGESLTATNCVARFGHLTAPVNDEFELELLAAWIDNCASQPEPVISRWCESSS